MTIETPIWIPCEGSNQRGHNGICAMCGRLFYESVVTGVEPHRRQDLTAMIDRGDFDD